MARTSDVLAVSLVGCVMMMLMDSASALLHVVGGSIGWTVPDNETHYHDWAKTRTFTVGDQLIFVYDPGHDNIISVSKKDYEECHTNNPIEAHFRGPTALTLTTPGHFYYYSMYGLHCKYGQRLHVTVLTSNDSSTNQFTNRKLLLVSDDVISSPASAPAPSPAPAITGGAASSAGVATVVFSVVAASLLYWW